MSVPAYSITTTIVPSTSSDLTTLATWKSDWGLPAVSTPDDDFLTRTISRCSAAAASFCNRTFGTATYQDVVRLEQGYQLGRIVRGNRDPIVLGRWPLVSISSAVEISGGQSIALSEGTDYEGDYRSGRLYRLDSGGNPRDWPTCQIVITYVAGYVLPGQLSIAGGQRLPLDVEDAVGRMVYARYAERRRDPFIAEESVVGVGTVRYLPSSGTNGNLSPDVLDILDNYRVPVTA